MTSAFGGQAPSATRFATVSKTLINQWVSERRPAPIAKHAQTSPRVTWYAYSCDTDHRMANNDSNAIVVSVQRDVSGRASAKVLQVGHLPK